jgi:hypothetical protein
LTGPALHQEQWLRAAAHAGLAIRPSARRVPAFGQRGATESDAMTSKDRTSEEARAATRLSVVAGRCVESLVDQHNGSDVVPALSRLAGAVGAGLMTASLVRHERELCFANAVPTVDVGRRDVADAILAALGLSS